MRTLAPWLTFSSRRREEGSESAWTDFMSSKTSLRSPKACLKAVISPTGFFRSKKLWKSNKKSKTKVSDEIVRRSRVHSREGWTSGSMEWGTQITGREDARATESRVNLLGTQISSTYAKLPHHSFGKDGNSQAQYPTLYRPFRYPL